MIGVRPVALLGFCVGMAVLAPAARGMTADDLIAKNIEARGGLARLTAIRSLRATGIVRLGGGDGIVEQTYTLLQTRAGGLRRERTMQGLTAITAFDGAVGWSLNPFRGRREAQLLPPDAVKGLVTDADIDGPLVDYKKKGSTVTYAGTEDIDGTEAHKLHVALRNGDALDVYLDPDYFLEIREISHRTVRGVEEQTETDPGNYAKVDGVLMPFSIESGAKGGDHNYRIAFTKIEVNAPVDDSVFRFPTAAPAPGKGGVR